MPRILIVEDEPAIADTLVYALESECYQVSHVLTGGEALDSQKSSNFDLAILDVGLPDMTGFELCRQLREQCAIPILFLTARGGELDRVIGLEIGGDDYVTKPFSPREVVARVRAILRRASPAEAVPVQEPKLLRVDENGKRIFCGEVRLDLTAHEYRLAKALIERPERVLSREQLLEQAWEDPLAVTDRTVDAHVKSLRAKLRAVNPEAGESIQTRRGLGYAYIPVSQ